MKKLAAVFLPMILLFSCFPMAVAAEASAQDDIEIKWKKKGQDVILENVEILDNGWICITQEVTGSPCPESENTAETSAQDDVEIKWKKEGQDIILENVEVLDNGWVCITQEVTGSSCPERENTKVFSHTIFDRDGIELAVIYATVTGEYSQADSYAALTGITGSFTGDSASSFTYSLALSGAAGSVTVYFNDLSAATFSYEILTNGSIQWI